jgi:GNAT superfamily N-acetyltransferase
MHVRPVQVADGPAFLALVDALAEFEKLPGPDEDAKKRLLDHAFCERPLYELLVGEIDGRVEAYAAYFVTYSTFLAKPTLYLEDLFVHPRARRNGLASAMMERLRAIAEERGCGRFEWSVLDWNTGAHALYERIGAEQLPEWVLCRVVL